MSERQIRIVPMTADHLDELERLERICFSRPWSKRMLAEELDNACAAFLVAEDGETGARGNQLSFLTLEVRPSNEAAIALYQSFGFEEVGRRRNYYDLPKEDALILTRYFNEEAKA